MSDHRSDCPICTGHDTIWHDGMGVWLCNYCQHEWVGDYHFYKQEPEINYDR